MTARHRGLERIVRRRNLFSRFAHFGWVPFLTIFGAFGACVWAVLAGPPPLPYRIGEVLQQDVISRVSFRTIDEIATARKRDKARDDEPNTYTLDNGVVEKRADVIVKLVVDAREAKDLDELNRKYDRLRVSLTSGQWHALKTATDFPIDTLKSVLDRFAKNCAENGLMERHVLHEEFKATGTLKINAVRPDGTVIKKIDLAGVITLDKLGYNLKVFLARYLAEASDELQGALSELFAAAIDAPNLQYNREKTIEFKNQRAERVKDVMKEYPQGFPLAGKGTTVTTELRSLLIREHELAYERALAHPGFWERRAVGNMVLMLLLFVFLLLFVRLFVADFFLRHTRLFVFLAIYSATVLAARLFLAREIDIYFFPLCLAIALTTILFGIEASVLTLLGVTVPVCMMLGAEALNIAPAFFGSLYFSYRLRKRPGRTRFGEAGFWAGAITLATMMAVEFGFSMRVPHFILVDAAIVFGVPILVGALLAVSMPYLERLFGIVTDDVLMELCSLSHPLLEKLAQEAPGTMSHSLNLATMAEAAARAVGANPLLARAGAYFHDIGKLERPEYFVENETGRSRHENISEHMSVLVIVNHARAGLEYARSHRLPKSICDIVEQHHGTALVEYFYRKVSERDGVDVEPDAFRYPGPKPSSREAAIVMIADAVEGASRVFKNPSAKRLSELVHSIVVARIDDQQFAQCPLTLRELAAIEDSIVKSMVARFHQRKRYGSEDRLAQSEE